MKSKIKQKFFREFKDRNKFLKELGFESYKDYIKSERWKTIRNKHIKKHNECEYCKDNLKLNVHHLEYEKIGSLSTDYLITLCENCHLFSHAVHRAFPELTIRQSSHKAKLIIKYFK